MKNDILYLGDTAIKEAASYLAGVMTHFGLGFDYLPSDQKVTDSLLSGGYRLFIVSDYQAGNFTSDKLATLAKLVEAGAGLLMIGGWESFTGLNCEYTRTILKDVLPVLMQDTDDRVNWSQPCLIEKNNDHPIISRLPFDAVVPGIGGFNQFSAKPEAKTILSTRRFNVQRAFSGFEFQPFSKTDPLLVVGTYGKGRVTAFASDVAPHWVGGLVDWGNSRVSAQGPGANAIEVGNWYALFFGQMVKWTARLID